MSGPLLKAEGLTRKLAGDVPVTLVSGAHVEIHVGEFVAIRGPSGSGKSSLLYLLGLLDQPSEGKIWLNGIETTAMDEESLAAVRLKNIGFVFQFHFLLPEFSALENVMLPMRKLGVKTDAEIQHHAQMLLDKLGLADHAHKPPKKLSGGQCQRVAIARALANDPPLILADEPTGNLDSASSQNVQQILRDLAHQGRSVVAVTHDTDFAKSADRIITIIDGKIAA